MSARAGAVDGTRSAASFEAPVREQVEVVRLSRRDGGFALDTSDGSVQAKAVVVANGAYQRPNRPAAAAELPSDLAQLDADDYRHPGSVPSGAVLIIGSGQTGCQIAEELHEAGRDVVMSCGRAPWIPRRLGGHDIVWWALETGFLDQPVDALPTPAVRLAANLQNSGHGGGHDLHFRTLRTLGITLVGRFVGAERRRASFADDLAASVGWATTGTASS